MTDQKILTLLKHLKLDGVLSQDQYDELWHEVFKLLYRIERGVDWYGV